MNDRDNKVLESYLNTLDRSLMKLSTSDRAEIIIEIKGHVLDAMEREDGRSLDSVLSSLGEPESVANKYLLERGMNPGQASKTPIVKWLTIGFLGTVGMFTFVIVLALVFIFFFDKDNGSDSKSKFEFSSSSHDAKSIISMTPDMKFKLIFNNGKIDIENTESGTVSWECKLEASKEPVVTNVDGLLTLDLSESKGVKCDIQLPMISAFELEGVNGKVDYDSPRVDSSIMLSNGKLDFDLVDGMDYDHEIKVGAGIVKGFPDSIAGGTRLRVNLGNGVVEAD